MNLRAAIATLKDGGVVVFPTETSYGIGCDATNQKAVRRVFALKGRMEGKGTPLIVESLAAAERWGKFNPTAKKLAKKYWPGALTIIVPKRGKIAKGVLQDGTVALRVSSHPVARALAKGLGRPLVATSANRSGKPPCYSVRAFLKQLGPIRPIGQIGIVDLGALPKHKPTTLVKIVGEEIEVLRQGKIKL